MKDRFTRTRAWRGQRRGSVLIIALSIILILASLVLVLSRSTRVEALASVNQVAALEASAIEKGAEQYVLRLVEQGGDGVLTLTEDSFRAIPVGTGYFWIIRPNYGDTQLPVYGLLDESSKLNLNTATADMMAYLPGMMPDVAEAILDWRDEDSEPRQEGAENEYYLTLPQPYYCKNAAYETVEELLLVRGVTPELLYGMYGLNASQWLQDAYGGTIGTRRSVSGGSSMMATDEQLARGLYDLLTIYSQEPATTNTGGTSGGGGTGGGGGGGGRGATPTTRPTQGLINVNTAPREVLQCLPGLDESDVNVIISQRQMRTSATDTTWVANALQGKATNLNNYITGRAYQFSADIVAVNSTGRAFKRCRIVVDARTTPAKIIYRKDLTERGWPLEPDLLSALKRGEGLPYQPGIMPGGEL
jgi:type II secretory pathway component PulK